MTNNSFQQLIRQTISRQERLHPFIFDGRQKMVPELRRTVLQMVQKSISFMENTFIGIRLKDIVLCGSCAGYLYNHNSIIDIYLVWEMENGLLSQEELEDKLEIFNGASLFGNISANGSYQYNFRYCALMPQSSGVYSILKDKWLSFPLFQSPSSSPEEFMRKFSDYCRDKHDFMVRLPKNNKGYLSLEDTQKAEKHYQNIKDEAMKALSEIPEKEYSAPYLFYRCFRAAGYYNKMQEYIISCYDYNFNYTFQD